MQNRRIKASSLMLFACGIVFFMFVDQARKDVPTPSTATIGTANPYLASRQNWNNKNKLFLKEYINLEDDNSLYRYVSSSNPLNDTAYEPAMLVDVSSDYIIQRSKGMQLRPEANAALNDLGQAFYEAFGKNLYLVSAYRSYRLQKEILDAGCSRNRCAKAGTSEHQLGLTVDIHVGSNGRQNFSMSNKNSEYYRRLEQNAHKFGWHNTFQKGVAIDGQMEEGWHWRYIGKSLATYLRENDLTLGEYYATRSLQ